jgi:hypothetical protein
MRGGQIMLLKALSDADVWFSRQIDLNAWH